MVHERIRSNIEFDSRKWFIGDNQSGDDKSSDEFGFNQRMSKDMAQVVKKALKVDPVLDNILKTEGTEEEFDFVRNFKDKVS